MELTVNIDRMRMRAYHGLLPQERLAGNIFTVSVSLTFPITEQDIESDSIDGTVNYAVLADIIKEEMAVPSNMIEHVALRLKRRMCALVNGPASGSVTVTKLTPPIAAAMQGASVTLAW